jgi:O-antigen/teichoic acid export membrane protein
MSLTRQVVYNTVVQIIGKVITTIFSLFLVVALTRYLGVSGYGEYTTIFAFLAFFGVVADFGFFWILVREIAHPDADVDSIASNILTLRTVLGIVVYSAAYLASYLIPQYATIRVGIGIAAISTLFLALNSTYVGIFQNKLRMDKPALTDVIGRAVILFFTLYFIRISSSLNVILWAFAAGNIVNLLANAWLGRVYVKIRLAFDMVYWKKIFIETLPMAVILVLGLIYFKIDTFMLSLMKSSVDVGIYGPPYRVLEVILLLPGMFMGNIFPIVTRYIHTKDNRVYSTLQKSFEFLLILAVPIALMIIYDAYPIIKLVAGQAFVDAHTIRPVFGVPATSVLALQILIVAVAFSFISIIFNYLVISLGKQSKLIWPNVLFVLFNVGSNLLAIRYYSYIGAAVTTVLTEFLVLVFTYWVASRYFILKLNFHVIWKVAVAGLIMCLVFHFGYNNINWVILTAITGFIYLIVLVLTGAIDKEMIKSLVIKEKVNEEGKL